MQQFLGIDQGSTSTKAVLVNTSGEISFEASTAVSTQMFADGRVELDPEEILTSVQDLVARALQSAGGKITAMGLAAQRSGVLAWDSKSGKVCHPLISHRDSRARDLVNSLRPKYASIIERTLMPVMPQYAAGKISLLQAKFPDEAVHVGTLDSFLVHRLSDEKCFVTDDSMAARTMLYNLLEGKWDQELCQIFGVNLKRLPEVVPSIGGLKATHSGIPMCAMMGDQQAALYSGLDGSLERNSSANQVVVLNLGTVASICMPSHELKICVGCVPSVLCSGAGQSGQSDPWYLLEAIVNSCARVIYLICDKFGLDKSVKPIEIMCREALGRSSPAQAFFPLDGTGSPDFRSDLPCVLENWDEEDKSAFARALIESIGGMVTLNLENLVKQGHIKKDKTIIKVMGGGADLDYLLQYIADCSNLELAKVTGRGGGARGAALAAMRALGVKDQYNSEAGKVFKPLQSGARKRYEEWLKLRARVLAGNLGNATVYQTD